MNPFATSALVFTALLVGAYAIAVVDRVARHGVRRVASALTMPARIAASTFRQQDLAPKGRDRVLLRSSAYLAFATVALGALVIPIGNGLVGFSPSIGLFFFLVVLGPFVVAMFDAGWGSGSKEGVFGAFRAVAHLLSYEVPLGFAAIGPAMAARSLSLTRIVDGQATLWYVVWQPLGFVLFLVTAPVMTYRHPFDLPIADEIGGGVLGARAGASLALMRVALDALFLLVMALGATLFLGGWRGPLLPGPLWFALKTLGLAALVLVAARRLPRLRQDQMLSLAWKILLPASLVNVALVGVLALVLPAGVLR